VSQFLTVCITKFVYSVTVTAAFVVRLTTAIEDTYDNSNDDQAKIMKVDE